MDEYYDDLTYLQKYELSRLGITLDPDTLTSGLADEIISELNNTDVEQRKMLTLIRNSHYLESFSNIEKKEKIIEEKYNEIKHQHKQINKQETKSHIENVKGESTTSAHELIKNSHEQLILNEINLLSHNITTGGYLGHIPEKHSDLIHLKNKIDRFYQCNKILCSFGKKPKHIIDYQDEISLHTVLTSMINEILKIKNKQNKRKKNRRKAGKWKKSRNIDSMINEFKRLEKTKHFLYHHGVFLSKIPEDHYTMLKQMIMELQELGSNFIPSSLDEAQFEINKIKLISLGITENPSSFEESQKMVKSEEFKKELQKLGCLDIPKSFEERKQLLDNKKNEEDAPQIDRMNEYVKQQKEQADRFRDWWGAG